MPDSPQAPPLAELELALASTRPDRAAEAGLRAMRAGVPPLEVLRTAARTFAARYDPGSGLVPHGLAALASAACVQGTMDRRDLPLAVLQAVALAASERKQAAPQRPAPTVSGEVTHLGRSALLAARAGAAADAEPLFLSLVEEGWERRMAGDLLFRASLEDCGENGHKLLVSVKAWQLARILGFRDARAIVRPAVQYLLHGERNRKPFEVALALLGKEGVDLAAVAAGGRPLDDDGRMRLATLLAASTDEGCLDALLTMLRDGYAATSLAEGVGVEAAKRLLAAEGYHIELVHVLLFARAARFALEFSRTDERLYALLEASLRVRSPAPHLPSVAVADANDEASARQRVAQALQDRRPREAAANVRHYLARGYPPRPLLASLVRAASLDSSLANQGHNLLLAETCVAEFAATRAPEFLMALAKSVAASPKDLKASAEWEAGIPA